MHRCTGLLPATGALTPSARICSLLNSCQLSESMCGKWIAGKTITEAALCACASKNDRMISNNCYRKPQKGVTHCIEVPVERCSRAERSRKNPSNLKTIPTAQNTHTQRARARSIWFYVFLSVTFFVPHAAHRTTAAHRTAEDVHTLLRHPWGGDGWTVGNKRIDRKELVLQQKNLPKSSRRTIIPITRWSI